MNSSTPFRASNDASSATRYPSSSRQRDEAVPSTSRQQQQQQRSSALRSTLALGESTFDSLALDVSYAAGLDVSGIDHVDSGKLGRELSDPSHLWEDIGVVEYLERRLGPPDESTPEERVETLREILAETDIHEGDGDLSDFLFHVARTKYGKVYIRVIRTLLLNRGKRCDRRDRFTVQFNLNDTTRVLLLSTNQ